MNIHLSEQQLLSVQELTSAELALLRRLARHPMTSEHVLDANDWERLAYLVHFGFVSTSYSARTGLKWDITPAGRVVVRMKRADMIRAVAS